MWGAELSLKWALGGAAALAPGGRFLLYTGAAIIEGIDGLKDMLLRHLDSDAFGLAYEEIDPDIFGEELLNPAYHGVDRIAAVGIVITRRAALP
jgi:hypothetical protein